MAQVEPEWTRPYRAGLVAQALWWFDLVLAVPLAAFGVVAMVVGAAGGEMPVPGLWQGSPMTWGGAGPDAHRRSAARPPSGALSASGSTAA